MNKAKYHIPTDKFIMKLDEEFQISNMDCIVFAQVPKISPHKKKMKENIAGALNIHSTLVNVKATTTERLGFIGKEQGIAAQCTLLVKTIPKKPQPGKI